MPEGEKDGSGAKKKKVQIDVDNVAMLANLHLSPEKSKKMAEDMKSIVEFADELSSVDTEGVPVTARVVPMKNVFREDVVSSEKFTRDELLAIAKTKTDEYIYVPKTFE